MPRIPPPLLALAAAVAQRALTGPTASPAPVRRAAAATAALSSAALAGAAAREFRRHRTTVEPFRPERASALVTTGPNALTRNPMYVGMAGVLVAHALWRGAWVAWLPVAGFVALIDRLQVAAEEPALAARFGSDYEVYRASTPRWLGVRSFRGPGAIGAAAPGR